MRVAIALFAVVALSGRVQAQFKSIDDLKIEKVGLDTTEEEFLKMHPAAEIVSTKEVEKKLETKIYAVGIRDSESYSKYSFRKGKLYLMSIEYTPKGVDNAGGSEAFVEKIVKKYGDATKVEKNSDTTVILWSSEGAGNMLAIKISGDSLNLSLTHKERFTSVMELRKKAK